MEQPLSEDERSQDPELAGDEAPVETPKPADIFTDLAHQRADEASVLMLYQLLMGRNPESSFVIIESTHQKVSSLMKAFLRSTEFANHILGPLEAGTRLRHERLAPAPTAEQCAWLSTMLNLSPEAEAEIAGAGTWPKFFHAFLAAIAFPLEEGAPRPPAAAPAPPPEEKTARFFVAEAKKRLVVLERAVAEMAAILGDLEARLPGG